MTLSCITGSQVRFELLLVFGSLCVSIIQCRSSNTCTRKLPSILCARGKVGEEEKGKQQGTKRLANRCHPRLKEMHSTTEDKMNTVVMKNYRIIQDRFSKHQGI